MSQITANVQIDVTTVNASIDGNFDIVDANVVFNLQEVEATVTYDQEVIRATIVLNTQSVVGIETWEYYLLNWSVEPSLNTSLANGDVYDYALNGTTRYRFVPNTYDSTQDAFYSAFDGTNLSGLITTRG